MAYNSHSVWVGGAPSHTAQVPCGHRAVCVCARARACVCVCVCVCLHRFVAMFCASFPLAPVAALVNNALEGRLDAHKQLVFRRGFGEQAPDIGVWFHILQVRAVA